ncbi:hypothetical protein ACFVJS_26060 [Nocardioides sp. NPDC057772]|uniref:hypothetical protein n=1 Tax=Nocardioides sp. NPDC057772 TaxID=3346245 RepID=UPI003671C0F1
MRAAGADVSLPVPAWRRTVGAVSAMAGAAAAIGAVQLVTDTFAPPVSDLRPLGLESWVLPGLWLAASVAVPCLGTAVLAWRRSRWMGPAAVGAGMLLLVELAVQVPFVGFDPLQVVMGTVAISLAGLGWSSARRSVTKDQSWRHFVSG